VHRVLLLLLLLGCGAGSPSAEPPTPAPLSADDLVSLSLQLEGEWRLLRTAEEEQQRSDTLAHLEQLGDDPQTREMRAAILESYGDGMTVTDSTITLRLMRREVGMTWTLAQDRPDVFSIETLDGDGRRQTFDVTFEGPDRVTLSGPDGGPVSRFERKGPARDG